MYASNLAGITEFSQSILYLYPVFSHLAPIKKYKVLDKDILVVSCLVNKFNKVAFCRTDTLLFVRIEINCLLEWFNLKLISCSF